MAGFLQQKLGIGTSEAPKKAKYKSPTGRVSEFDYEDMESSISTKASVFETSTGNGTYVRSNGSTSGRFPWNCIFHGNNHEKAASYFMASLLEKGVGLLSHPQYPRDINVVPVGEIGRISNYVTGDGQTIISVTLYETTGLKIGKAKGLPGLMDQFSEVSAEDFANSVRLKDPVYKASFKNVVSKALSKFSSAMSKASNAVSKVSNAIEQSSEAAKTALDITVGKPLALARQTQILLGEPRRANDSIMAKLNAYNGLASDIFEKSALEPSKYAAETANQFHFDRMMGKSIVANSAMLLANPLEFKLKKEFLDAADKLRLMMESLQSWQDENFAVIDSDTVENYNISTGGGMYDLNQLVSLVVGNLIFLSFASKTEMSEELSSDRTPIDLCFEFYGTTEFETFDAFMLSNNIVGDEYFLIPKGRRVVWYV